MSPTQKFLFCNAMKLELVKKRISKHKTFHSTLVILKISIIQLAVPAHIFFYVLVNRFSVRSFLSLRHIYAWVSGTPTIHNIL